MTRMSRFLWSMPLFVVLALGCSHSKMPSSVHGKVTYKGQPVTAGTITFHRVGQDQSGVYAYPLLADGTYSGAGMPLEEMVVTIDTESANPKRKKPVYGRGKKGADPASEYRKEMQARACPSMPGPRSKANTFQSQRSTPTKVPRS